MQSRRGRLRTGSVPLLTKRAPTVAQQHQRHRIGNDRIKGRQDFAEWAGWLWNKPQFAQVETGHLDDKLAVGLGATTHMALGVRARRGLTDWGAG